MMTSGRGFSITFKVALAICSVVSVGFEKRIGALPSRDALSRRGVWTE
jgi:hypothetical protein